MHMIDSNSLLYQTLSPAVDGRPAARCDLAARVRLNLRPTSASAATIRFCQRLTVPQRRGLSIRTVHVILRWRSSSRAHTDKEGTAWLDHLQFIPGQHTAAAAATASPRTTAAGAATAHHKCTFDFGGRTKYDVGGIAGSVRTRNEVSRSQTRNRYAGRLGICHAIGMNNFFMPPQPCQTSPDRTLLGEIDAVRVICHRGGPANASVNALADGITHLRPTPSAARLARSGRKCHLRIGCQFIFARIWRAGTIVCIVVCDNHPAIPRRIGKAQYDRSRAAAAMQGSIVVRTTASAAKPGTTEYSAHCYPAICCIAGVCASSSGINSMASLNREAATARTIYFRNAGDVVRHAFAALARIDRIVDWPPRLACSAATSTTMVSVVDYATWKTLSLRVMDTVRVRLVLRIEPAAATRSQPPFSGLSLVISSMSTTIRRYRLAVHSEYGCKAIG